MYKVMQSLFMGVKRHQMNRRHTKNILFQRLCSCVSMLRSQDFFYGGKSYAKLILSVDLGPAAHILTEAFYSHRTNFITFQIEKLKTALSLESTFKQRNNPMGQMFVACSSVTGKVVGFAEVDVCSLKKDCDEVRECSIDDSGKSNDLPRPYMYNLAVDKRWQRKGIATALVTACENFVANTEQSIHDQSIIKYRLQEHSHLGLDSACKEFVEDTDEEGRWIYLRVRKNNNGAISFYRRLGYDEIDPVTIGITYSDVNSNSGEEGELILMAKELNTDS